MDGLVKTRAVVLRGFVVVAAGKDLAAGEKGLLGVPSVVKMGDQDGITRIALNLLTIRICRIVDRDGTQTDL